MQRRLPLVLPPQKVGTPHSGRAGRSRKPLQLPPRQRELPPIRGPSPATQLRLHTGRGKRALHQNQHLSQAPQMATCAGRGAHLQSELTTMCIKLR